MLDPLFETGDGTDLTPEERKGLKPAHIRTRAELNEAEHLNILRGTAWAQNNRRKWTVEGLVSEDGLRMIHKKMLCDVWEWAGVFRTTEKNIGVLPPRIYLEHRNLKDDVAYWVNDQTPKRMPPDEMAARFHHRLVWIHLFPNGNGRHARLAANIFLKLLGQPPFTYGKVNLTDASAMRAAYVAALKKADLQEFDDLMIFCRS